MSNRQHSPAFTLRGHDVGVTALTYCTVYDQSYLVSGDEEGNLFVWDLAILRKSVSYPKIARSRIQSLKAIRISISGEIHDVIFIHSRSDGISLLDLTKSCSDKPVILATYDSFKSLFSRGDAIPGSENTAILAYPSCLQNDLVTIRIVGNDVQSMISGTASRIKEGRNCPLFDISLKESSEQRYILCAGFEDGDLYVFSFSPKSTKTVPHLNCTGLDVQLIKQIHLKLGDFISAFDFYLSQDNRISAVVGSPAKELTFLQVMLDQDSEDQEPIKIPLKRQGVSAISIRPDKKMSAVACWDSTVKLYSMDTNELLACMRCHSKQVQDLLFFENRSNQQNLEDKTDSQNADRNQEKSYILCCASSEGTISISTIY